MLIDNNVRFQAKPNYIHRKVGGNNVLIPIAENVASFNGFIELNSAAAFIWLSLKDAASINEIKGLYAKEFGVDEDSAENDVKEFFLLLFENGMITEVR